jgi:hypothetical protein
MPEDKKATPLIRRLRLPRRRWWFIGGASLVVAAGILVTVLLTGGTPVAAQAPEADKVLSMQANMPFQILIPGYLPKEFDRAAMEIAADLSGPGGEPMVQMTYTSRKGGIVTVREWVPVNPDMEILASSRPIETKWGQGWYLKEGEDLAAVWADVGPLRVSVYSQTLDRITGDQLLQVTETLGPASNKQVFSFVVNPSSIKEMAPPPPQEIPINAEGVQEFTLVVTPGGYTPLRFSVKKGVPVRMTFRQLGEVGCGNELIFPADPNNSTALRLDTPKDKKVLEFTPTTVGEFQFQCSHQMYRGVMTVRE